MSVDEDKTFIFKLYVFKNQKEAEIRKFGLKTNELSFEKMEETLQAIFPNLNESNFTLLWKGTFLISNFFLENCSFLIITEIIFWRILFVLFPDQANDMITLSSSKEFSTFEEYITKSIDDEIKLFINLENELFSIAKKFDNLGLNLNYTCKCCRKTIIPKCLDCSKQNLPQEHKILNIVDQSLGNMNRSEDKSEVKSINTLSAGKPINNQKASDSQSVGFSFNSGNFSTASDHKKTPIFGASPGSSTNMFK